ncbi:hypothetical protein C0993_012388 [Termitomyces sp. T159_Od127]|nr:hypothetical protein C0993_012388 [Termitomyces sp. T159_Od127]
MSLNLETSDETNSLKIPDETKIHRLLSRGAVQDDYRVALTDVTFLKKTENNHYIFRAKSSGQDVIVKFTYEDDDGLAIPRLRHESQIYVDYLKPLWGVHVPRFYGFYLHDDSSDSSSCACIVLQHCGEPAVSDLSQLNDYRGREYGIKRFRNDTMDIVFRLHSPEIGLEHEALNASHVLDFEGKPFLIDFGCAESHDCLAWEEVGQLTRETLPIKEGEHLEPMSINYCILGSIEYSGTKYACDSITSAAVLYEQALMQYPKFRPAQEMWDEAVERWKYVHSNWKKYHPDAEVEPPLGIIDFEKYLEIHPGRCWHSVPVFTYRRYM